MGVAAACGWSLSAGLVLAVALMCSKGEALASSLIRELLALVSISVSFFCLYFFNFLHVRNGL